MSEEDVKQRRLVMDIRVTLEFESEETFNRYEEMKNRKKLTSYLNRVINDYEEGKLVTDKGSSEVQESLLKNQSSLMESLLHNFNALKGGIEGIAEKLDSFVENVSHLNLATESGTFPHMERIVNNDDNTETEKEELSEEGFDVIDELMGNM